MRTIIRLLMALTLLLLVASAALPAARAQEDKIAFIIYTDVSVEFFVPVVNGANDAAKAWGVDISIEYGNNDPATQNALIEAAIADGVGGIAVMIPDDNAYDETICRARDAGIAVVSMNVDDSQGAAGNCRMAFIGQDFVATGYLIGQRMIADHGIGAGDLVLAPVEAPAAVYAVQRAEGVKMAMDEVGATVDVIESTFNIQDALTIEIDYLRAHPETRAIIGLGSVPLTVAPAALQETGMSLPVGGFDLTADIIAGIEDGVITATVDQQPYSQGFYAVTQLVLYLKYGLYPSDMDTGGLGLVDGSNVTRVKQLTGTIR